MSAESAAGKMKTGWFVRWKGQRGCNGNYHVISGHAILRRDHGFRDFPSQKLFTAFPRVSLSAIMTV